MKADLHLHSKYSRRPTEWILKKLGCPESFSEPFVLYRIAKRRGMNLVTLTDHNSIEGCLDIAHLPDVFLSEEVTAYFPEDRCKIHVLVYDIDEAIHREIQRVRENIYDLVNFLSVKGIVHAVAHPLYPVNGKLTFEHIERLLLLFRYFEINGSRNEQQNRCLSLMLSAVSPKLIEDLAEKHSLYPGFEEPWSKRLVAGSDDHSSLWVARRSTRVEGAQDRSQFFDGIRQGKASVPGIAASPQALARTLYSIAYQYYSHSLDLSGFVTDDLVFILLDRYLNPESDKEPRLMARLHAQWSNYRMRKNGRDAGLGVLDLLKQETNRLICEDPELSMICRNGSRPDKDLDQQWLGLVNRVSNKVLCHLGDKIIESLSTAHFIRLFDSLGAAGALYCVLAPYFIAFSLHSGERQFGRDILGHFGLSSTPDQRPGADLNVAHFTDTLYEVNGVALTTWRQIDAAKRFGKSYQVVTCRSGMEESREGVRNFEPVGVCRLPEYPEQKLYYPPFLEMLEYCYKSGFSHIHVSTPGPLGLAGLVIARILGLPAIGTYHTALPQYAEHLTGDHTLAAAVSKYVVGFYDQMDCVYVPSRATGAELVERGLAPHKLVIMPRGVDTEEFKPGKTSKLIDESTVTRNTIKVLYVGRMSKEKGLPLLAEVFKEIAREVPGVSLVIVGDGPYRPEMEAALESTPTLFTGYLEGEELASVYSSCDMFVFPSITDTFGNVVLEAQASGLPVIVTDVGGPQENLIHSKTGLVVKGDDAGELLHAILKLAGDEPLRRSMGEAAREYVLERSFDRAFLEGWGIYSTVQADSRPAGQSPGPDFFSGVPALFADRERPSAA